LSKSSAQREEKFYGMVGAVIVTHSRMGERLIETAEYIVGKMDGIIPVSLDLQTNAFEARRRIAQAIKQVNQGDGVLILTDLFVGSPSNIALSFLNPEKLDVITGVNLPMVITFWNKREGGSLIELAKSVQLSGVRSIARVKTLMETKGAFGREGPQVVQQ
jgi:PTS system mannose-specific IIA component